MCCTSSSAVDVVVPVHVQTTNISIDERGLLIRKLCEQCLISTSEQLDKLAYDKLDIKKFCSLSCISTYIYNIAEYKRYRQNLAKIRRQCDVTFAPLQHYRTIQTVEDGKEISKTQMPKQE